MSNEEAPLDLSILGQEALDKFKEAQAEKIRVRIGLLVGRRAECIGVIKRLENQLDKAKKSRDKAIARLEAIMKGDWKALPKDDEKFKPPVEDDNETT